MNNITRQASSPVGSPFPDTKRRGGKTRRRGANRGKAKRMTMKGHRRAASKQTAETDDIMMTSQERARHEQRGQAER